MRTVSPTAKQRPYTNRKPLVDSDGRNAYTIARTPGTAFAENLLASSLKKTVKNEDGTLATVMLTPPPLRAVRR